MEREQRWFEFNGRDGFLKTSQNSKLANFMTNIHIQVNKMDGGQGCDLGVLKSTTTVEYFCFQIYHSSTILIN